MALTKIKSHSVALNSLTVANIADNAIDATKIASNSILTRHIDDNQIGIDQLNVSDGSSGQVLSTNGSGTLSFIANTVATNLTVFGRSANISVPITASTITVVARSGNVSVGVS